jgi:hypothetical protein
MIGAPIDRQATETSPDGSYASIYWYVQSPTGNYEIMVFGPKISKTDAVTIADEF